MGDGQMHRAPDHPLVATALNNLALNLAHLDFDQGGHAEAEQLHKRSLAIREKVLGLDHPDVGTSLNNLALLYFAQGRYIEAEPLFKRSLAVEEKALGVDHLSTAITLNNLAEHFEAPATAH
jgi:tetratricopeptide (TPR) repeat protein